MKKKKRIHFEKIIVGFGLVIALALAGILVRTFYIRRGAEDVIEAAEPVGDEESDAYDWKGDYMDTMYLQTTLSIEGGVGGVYDVTLTWGEPAADDLSIWKCKAAYDKSHRALVYKDMTRKDMVIPSGEDEGESETHDIYSGGSGFFFLRGGKVYWEDKHEDFGDGMQFEKV